MTGHIEILRRSLLEKNDRSAAENRALLVRKGLAAINVLGGAGSGKTAILEGLLPGLRLRGCRSGVLEGDLATTRDAQRIAALDVPVVQLLTEGGCHLTAELVRAGLDRLPLDELDVVFIENVGNCVCPANFDLGEHARLVVLSVAEGDDKPAKYPHLFATADAIVFAKMDLLARTPFNPDRATRDIRALNAQAPIFRTSSDDPTSFEPPEWWVLDEVRRVRAAEAPPSMTRVPAGTR